MSVLEPLSESECYLWAILSDESGLDLAELVLTDEGNDDHCFRAWPFQWPWWRCNDYQQIDQGSRCISEGTPVLTSTGWKPIESVSVGDQVLTHKNRWRMVTEVFDNGVRDVVSIRSQGMPGELVLTPDHQMLARHARRGSVVKDGSRGKVLEPTTWTSLDEWRWNNGSQVVTTHCASPAEQAQALPEEWRFVEQAYRSGRQNYVADTLNLDWLWLYGLYIAEGSSYKDDVHAKAKWCLHKDEIEHVSKFFDRLGLSYSVDNPKDNGKNLQLNSRPMVDWLRKNTGRHSWEKYVAPWVLGLPEDCRRAVFDGLTYGDGWVRSSGRIDYSTTSRQLVLDLRLLAQSLGYTFSVTVNPPTTGRIEGREINCRESFSCGIELLDGRIGSNVSIEDGIAWTALKSATPSSPVRTWDLQVDEDHSFVANGLVVHNSSGKSMSIRLRAFVFPFIHPQQILVVTAPEGTHIQTISGEIEKIYLNNRLPNEMLKKGPGGIKHKPFEVNFQNGATIMGVIPQRTGIGMKGLHPLWLEIDEGQDFPELAWKEVIETLQQGTTKARWRVHGVTRGVQDKFYEFTKSDSGWTVHHYPAMYRPTWTDEERENKIKLYGGSIEDPDFRRNVYGVHGDATSVLFVLYRLLECADRNEESDYNTQEYVIHEISSGMVKEAGDIRNLIEIPYAHKNNYSNFWIGMDVGYTTDPSVIVVFGEAPPEKKGGKSRLKLLMKVVLKQIANPDQAQCVMHLIEGYLPKAFAMDSTGVGLPLFQDIQHLVHHEPELKKYLDRIKGYQFASKIVVDIDDTVEQDIYSRDNPDPEIKKNVLEHSTDVLRGMVDDKTLYLPWDTALIEEFRGQTYTFSKTASSSEEHSRRRLFSQGYYHTLDACRMAALGYSQHLVDARLASRRQKFVAVPTIFIT